MPLKSISNQDENNDNHRAMILPFSKRNEYIFHDHESAGPSGDDAELSWDIVDYSEIVVLITGRW